MKRIALSLVAVTLSLFAYATHLRCGYISVDRLSPSNLTCRITLTVFVSASSPVAFGSGYLRFGDSSNPLMIPEVGSTPRPDLGPGVGMATYSINYTFSGPGQYTITYEEPARNTGIINIGSSVTTLFHIATTINIDPFLGVYNTPTFSVDPFFKAKIGGNLSLSVGAESSDDYIITYELSVPRGTMNYKLPENFQVNPFTGLVTWDTRLNNQYIVGEYLFAVKVHQSKMINGNLYRLCTVERDFQIVLTEDNNPGWIFTNFLLDENNRIYIPEHESRTIKIFYEPNITENTELEVYSMLINSHEAFSFTTYDSATADIKVGVLTLTSIPDIVRDNPYVVTVRGRHHAGPSTLYAHDITFLYYSRDFFPELITSIQQELPLFRVFPNPVKDFFTVDLASSQIFNVRLITLTGQVIATEQFHESGTLDLRQLSHGVYLCEVTAGSFRRLIRVTKL